MEEDIIDKSLFITGKYGIQDKDHEMHFIKNIYPEIYHEKPKTTYFTKLFKICCCKKQKSTKEDTKSANVDESIKLGLKKSPTFESLDSEDLTQKKDNLEKVFESMLERHLDLNYFFQMCQDFELIKKVLFHERHLVLSP